MRYRPIWSVLVILSVLFLPACAQQANSTSIQLLLDYYNSSTTSELDAAIEALVSSDVGAEVIAAALREGIAYSTDVPLGWSVYEYLGADGRTRPYHVYVPTDYDPAESYTLLFDLHGAVSSPAQPAEYLMQRRRLWEPEAQEYGWILIVPHGDRNGTWFSANGHLNMMAELEFVKRLYNVDENKIFVSGFSDGGSGAYWQAFHNATPWAAFLAFHGHPAIGGYGPYQTYPRNLLNRPIRATTGEQDELYPPDEISPYIGLFTELGVDLEWVVYPGGHEAQFLATEAEFTIDLISTTTRNPYPSDVVWETSNAAAGRCDWVRIDEIADVGNNVEFDDINLAVLSDRIVFGASLAYQGGTLFTVAGLEPGSTAHLMGIKNGDQIIRLNHLDVLTQADLTYALAGKFPGDTVEAEIIRDGEPLTLTGTIPPDELIYRRDVPTGSIRVHAEDNQIDVAVSHVARFTLLISSEQFDLSQPLEVTTNGVVTFSEKVAPDVRFMLEQAAEDLDRTTVYETYIEIQVPAEET